MGNLPTEKLYRADHVGHILVNSSDVADWLKDGWSSEPVAAKKGKKPKEAKAKAVEAIDVDEPADIEPAPGEAAEFDSKDSTHAGIDLE